MKQDFGISAEVFVAKWEEACRRGFTAQWVADQLNMPKPIVLARAHFYRGKGIQLSKIPRRAENALDVDELNRQIARDRKPGMKQFESAAESAN